MNHADHQMIFLNQDYWTPVTSLIRSMFEVRELDSRKGRGVIATQALVAGQVALAAHPDIGALYSSFAPSHCHECYSQSTSANVCVKCKQFNLCATCTSPELLAAHEVACLWMCSLPHDVQSGDTDYLRFLLEYAARVQAGDMALMTAMAALCTNEDSQSPEVRQFCQSYSKLVTSQFNASGLVIDQEHLYRLLLQTKSNSIGFPFNEAEAMGWAMQKDICMLNHSCGPNCAVRQGEHGVIEVVVLRDVAAGEELFISYVDLDRFPETKERRRHLLEQYRFLCHCNICSVVGH
jgi:hypothetical protein